MRLSWLGTPFVLLLLLVPAGCAPQTSDAAHTVRVRIFANEQQVVVAAAAPPVVQVASNPPQRLGIPSSGVPVTLSPAGWRIGNATFAAGELTFQPDKPGSVSVNGSAYRGRYRFVPVAADRFDVVNDVDIDSYLASVVSREMPRHWHLEAYKAQAIIARTYAMYQAHSVSAERHFDLFADERSQVYGGVEAESAKSRAAVSQTAGVVVAFGPAGKEKIFKAYFSSCCGGVGQSAADAFGEADLPPLREKFAGNLCNASPRFNWAPVILSKGELTRRIRSWGARRNRPEKDMAMLVRIDIATVNRYHRPVRFFLTDARGLQYSLSGEELRWACNADANGGPVLSSSFVRPVSEAANIQFLEGHGWGHGVGMCQWCAQAMAERGMRHEDIVRLSYPGAALVRAY